MSQPERMLTRSVPSLPAVPQVRGLRCCFGRDSALRCPRRVQKRRNSLCNARTIGHSFRPLLRGREHRSAMSPKPRRGFATKPKVASSARLPWEIVPQNSQPQRGCGRFIIPKFCQLDRLVGHNLFEVEIVPDVHPKVGPQGQERANLGLCSATSSRLIKGVAVRPI
jgi:hypothetical protein